MLIRVDFLCFLFTLCPHQPTLRTGARNNGSAATDSGKSASGWLVGAECKKTQKKSNANKIEPARYALAIRTPCLSFFELFATKR